MAYKYMTQEEKAKAYDEALEIARKELQTCGSTDCDVARQIFRLFPELKKSDDERIRKKLLSSFKGIMADADEDELWYGLPYNDIIVWLEKQGEQKPYGQRKECLDCQFNYAGECKGSCAMKRSEQKSQRMISAEAKEALYDKPDAWSEKDEAGLGNALWAIKQAKTIAKDENDMGNLWYAENWLNSIKNRIQLKQEWTEEDEKRLKSCLNILQPKTLLGNVETINTNWLKSLKDRYTWKPSNEQIDALEHFVRSIGESGYASPYDNNTKLLYSLLEQLKKLKA